MDFLQTLTIPLLKKACKMRNIPVTGGKDILINRIHEYQVNPQPIPDKKNKIHRRSRDEEPQHNHVLDNKTHDDCPQCNIYGNPMDPNMHEETFEITETEEKHKLPENTTIEFEMGEDDLDEQLKNIVSNMNETGIESDEEDIESDEDPFENMDYGEELEEEE